MKNISLLFIVLGVFAACSTAKEVTDLGPQSSHKVYSSLFLMETNEVENWIQGEWKLSEGVAGRFGEPYTEFSYDPVRGKWMKKTSIGTNANREYTIIAEGSFKIEENYWGAGSHFINGSVLGGSVPGNILYEEIEKIGEDEFRVYLRSFDFANLPADLDPDNPDPKLAVRSFNGIISAVYKRVK